MAQSKEYQDLLTEMHKTNRKWGAEFKSAPIPQLLREAIEKYRPKTILDFGCGKGFLSRKLQAEFPNISVTGWDPSHGTELEGNYDMIVSTDVLEHVEPEYLDETIKDLYNRANIVQYHNIACYYATAILPNGMNAHLSVFAPDIWQKKFSDLGLTIINELVNVNLKKRVDHDLMQNGKKIVLEYECILEK